MAVPAWLKDVSPGVAIGSSKTARKVISPLVLGQFKHGGKVKKTGSYKLHKGEQVVPAHRRRASRRR